MKCIVSGGTGFLGRRLVSRLLAPENYVAIYTRNPGKQTQTAVHSYGWDPLSYDPPTESLNNYDVVFHLAGEPVAQRWNDAVKQRIYDSRVLGTRRLVDTIARVQHRPTVLVCASAIGYYGNRGDEVLTESSSPGSGFLVDACKAWEAEADRASSLGLRVVKLRIGFVLGKDGGALATMVPAFKLGIGGKLGDGKQWMPWVHVDDVVNLFVHAAENEVRGVWNATSPNPVTNADFTHRLGHVLHRPTFLPIPEFALKIAFGEFARHMLDSARVIPDAAIRAGFQFQFPEIGPALSNLLF